MNLSQLGFISIFNTALQGVTSNMLSQIQTVAYSILTVAFILGVYEAYFRQGSVRDLGLSLLKTAVAGIVIQNWGSFFSDVYNGMGSIASYIFPGILSAGQDVLGNWFSQFVSYYQQNGVNSWSLFTGGSAAIAGVLGYLMAIICAIFYFVAYFIFAILYAFWGCVLYVMGPLLIALMPSTSVNQLAKTYARNLAEWSCWPLLYTVFSFLAISIQKDTVVNILQSTNFSDVIQNTTNVIYISIMSLIYAVCLLLIPFLSHYIMGSDFGGFAGAAIALGRQASTALGGGGSMLSGFTPGISSSTAASGMGGGGSSHYGGETESGSGAPPRSLSTPPATTPANDHVAADSRITQKCE